MSYVLIAADYSQIELRILAHLSGDPLLTAAFRDRIDVHTQTAAEVFGVEREAVTAEQRRIAKAVNYGLSYGQSDFEARPRTLRRSRVRRRSRVFAALLPAVPGTIHKFMDEIVAVARAQGGARTLLGRWRPIANLMSKSPAARHAAERVAQNTPMQGTGADLIKLAMLRTHERITREKWPVRMLLTVHDELVFATGRRRSSPRLCGAPGCARKMEENVYKLSVPLDVDIGIGETWADA